MQEVAAFLWDSGLIWLVLLVGAFLLRSFFLALGAYVLFVGLIWLAVEGSLAVGMPLLIVGTVLVYFGVCERRRD